MGCALAAGACRAERTDVDTSASLPVLPDPVVGMRSLPHPVDTVAMAQAHLDRLDSATDALLPALVPADSQVVAMLIAHCEEMMRRKNMPMPADWTSTVAALRQDAIAMRGMPARQLSSYMAGHRQRIQRLLDLHRSMPMT